MGAEQHVEIEIPTATTEDVRTWAASVEQVGAIPSSHPNAIPLKPVTVRVTDHPFMGAVLTIGYRDRIILELAIFAGSPTQEEIDIMEDHYERKLRAV